MCGLTDWFVRVEAATEEEAIQLGRAEFVDRFQECEAYFATSAPEASSR